MLSHASTQRPRQQSHPNTHEVTVSLRISGDTPPLVPQYSSESPVDTPKNSYVQDKTCTVMSSKTELLECPMCQFTVLPKDDYILQLHFEQVHTTDSPFIIKDDPEPLPPSLPPRPSSKPEDDGDTPSSDDSDQEDSSVVCPETSCAEVVPLSDFNDHLDYHNAESLSFDETSGKYHSHHSSTDMQSSASTRRSHASRTKGKSVEHTLDTESSEAMKRSEGHGRKVKKHAHRHRRDTDDGKKSTIGRSIMGFNPFAKPDKTVKPPAKSARLGVCISSMALTPWLILLGIRTGPPCLGKAHAEVATRSA